ncbi:AsnC family transcriptional regulator [Hoeflea sp. BAL378]|uniref:Lrp/AsnC family transcriptional regulator n=1 Tax=Hoeflea sp. BAL378 TaxID=1547437 RepID=UPI00051322F0|nr:Lrp/AsnC family transcriptional regulator [Hoeflea sp. BAL378]KGF70517.1 AsnC family transcriptional regulator [Hoeflea sp. BAL378]
MAPIKLDDRDIKILAILSREGRISKSELAKRVNLSATPCWERLSRLEKAGIISGYQASIELRHIAPQVTVFVMAELDNHRAATFQAFEQAVAHYDEILSCWALGGGFDYLMQIVTRDIDSYQRLIDDLLARRAGLARYFTYIVTKPVKQSATPPFDILMGLDPETD